jgi:hypothetical protein
VRFGFLDILFASGAFARDRTVVPAVFAVVNLLHRRFAHEKVTRRSDSEYVVSVALAGVEL